MAVRDKELYQERDEALYQAYKAARNKLLEKCAEGATNSAKIHSRAVYMAINTPQQRFWITPDRAYRIVRVLLKGKGDQKTQRTKVKMHEELLNAFNRLAKKPSFRGMPVNFIASFAVYERSSGFFMNFFRATRIIKAQRLAHKPKKNP